MATHLIKNLVFSIIIIFFNFEFQKYYEFDTFFNSFNFYTKEYLYFILSMEDFLSFSGH